jgi:hypothetical protein
VNRVCISGGSLRVAFVLLFIFVVSLSLFLVLFFVVVVTLLCDIHQQIQLSSVAEPILEYENNS